MEAYTDMEILKTWLKPLLKCLNRRNLKRMYNIYC